MNREVIKATGWGSLVTLALAALIVLGSRNLSHFDAALVAYTFSILFATFGLTYRYVMWLQRPPTRTYWRQGWRALFIGGSPLRRLRLAGGRFATDILANRFIFKRGTLRGLTHMLLMWGCIIAAAITFPLVFGWLHFGPSAEGMGIYQAYVFGFPAFSFPAESTLAFFLFHGLVWASLLVIAGVMLAMRRRMVDKGFASVQQLAEDFMPLFLLFAVSVTGLMLTASYTWMAGFAFSFIAILHAITVIATFLWLPFGKFFHVFQRPAQLGVALYKDNASAQEPAHCRRCGHAFSSKMHVEDLIKIQRALGFDYSVNGDVEHYQWICPPCRRASLALAQGKMYEHHRGGRALSDTKERPPMPQHVNPGFGGGPLGEEDAQNFHP